MNLAALEINQIGNYDCVYDDCFSGLNCELDYTQYEQFLNFKHTMLQEFLIVKNQVTDSFI
jgi:hypothetical protein